MRLIGARLLLTRRTQARCSTRHKLGTQRCKDRASRQIATSSADSAQPVRLLGTSKRHGIAKARWNFRQLGSAKFPSQIRGCTLLRPDSPRSIPDPFRRLHRRSLVVFEGFARDIGYICFCLLGTFSFRSQIFIPFQKTPTKSTWVGFGGDWRRFRPTRAKMPGCKISR